MDLSRRKFLKVAGAVGAAAAAIALGLELTSRPSTPSFNETRTTVPLMSTTTSAQNLPLAVRNLSSEVKSYRDDLEVLANGQIDKSNFTPEGDRYRKFLADADNLRAGLKSYQIPNTETKGQVRRLAQLALSGLMLFSWEAEWLRLDINGKYFQRDQVANPRLPAKVVLKQLELEINPDDDYKQNVGKTYTDLENETDMAPSNRPKFKTLYEGLNPESRAKLKQVLEGHNPQMDPLPDYKKVDEGDLGIISINELLSELSDSNLADISTSVANGLKRNADVGRIFDRANTQLTVRSRNATCDWPDSATLCTRVNFFDAAKSAYAELPRNHTELSDYDFGLALLNTDTVRNINKIRYGYFKKNVYSVESAPIFWDVSTLANRDIYILSTSPESGLVNFSQSPGVKYDGKYYGLGFYTLDNFRGGLFEQPSGAGWEFKYFIIAKPLFGQEMNSIPVFAYVPGKGIVLGGS
jgi:hypothetical protein